MLEASTPGRDAMLDALPGMARHLQNNAAPPERVRSNGTVESRTGPVGFSAALLPYLDALGESDLARTQAARVRAALDEETGLYGRPGRYYDQNLTLFALGFREGQFWFDARGRLHTKWGG
jgi:endoglucanase